MARVTVEDCVLRIPNRFDLVMLAAQRARDISSGNPLTLERDNDKNPVVALREIADETIDIENLAEALIQGMQKYVEVDEPEEDIVDFDAPQVIAPEAPGEEAIEMPAGQDPMAAIRAAVAAEAEAEAEAGDQAESAEGDQAEPAEGDQEGAEDDPA